MTHSAYLWPKQVSQFMSEDSGKVRVIEIAGANIVWSENDYPAPRRREDHVRQCGANWGNDEFCFEANCYLFCKCHGLGHHQRDALILEDIFDCAGIFNLSQVVALCATRKIYPPRSRAKAVAIGFGDRGSEHLQRYT